VHAAVVGEQLLVGGEIQPDVELLRHLADAVAERDQIDVAYAHDKKLMGSTRARPVVAAHNPQGQRRSRAVARHKGCTSQGNYDYMVNFDPDLFPDRDRLRTALLAEGMPLTTAYPPMHQLEMFSSKGGLAPNIRDTSDYPVYASLHMPVAEYLSKTAIWFKTEVLTGSRQDAQSVVDAIEKVHRHAAEIGELEPTEW